MYSIRAQLLAAFGIILAALATRSAQSALELDRVAGRLEPEPLRGTDSPIVQENNARAGLGG